MIDMIKKFIIYKNKIFLGIYKTTSVIELFEIVTKDFNSILKLLLIDNKTKVGYH